MKISASIMAHPDRAPLVAELQAALDRPVPVYWDPHGEPSPDPDRVWRVAREVWSMYEPDADYHVLIQDDAVPCRDLFAGLERALATLPDPVSVSAYLGRGRTVPEKWNRLAAQADRRGASWVRSHALLWGVCLAVPTAVIPEMIAWCDQRSGWTDDVRVGAWFKRQQLDTWYTWPCLVDHRGGPSLTKRRPAERTAQRHHSGSALELAWTGPVVVDPELAHRRPARSAPHGASRPDTAGRTGRAV